MIPRRTSKLLLFSSLELQEYVQERVESNPVFEMQSKRDPVIDVGLYRGPVRIGRVTLSEDSVVSTEQLRAHIERMWRLTAPTGDEYRIGRRVIGDIDERGYFTGDVETIALEFDIPAIRVEQVLRLVQGIELTGIGARDLPECLSLQIPPGHPAERELKQLVEHHLEHLDRGEMARIMVELEISWERLQQLVLMLRDLAPLPGRAYEHTQRSLVIPDVVVHTERGRLKTYLTNVHIPKLRVLPEYEQMAWNSKIAREVRIYLLKNIDSARSLIRGINERQEIVLKVASNLVDAQRDYLDGITDNPTDVSLQELVSTLGVTEEGVQSVAARTLIQTPRGLFKLKSFLNTKPSRRSLMGPSTLLYRPLLACAEGATLPCDSTHVRDACETLN